MFKICRKNTETKNILDLELENDFLKKEIRKLKTEIIQKQEIIEHIKCRNIECNNENDNENENYGFNDTQLIMHNTELINTIKILNEKVHYFNNVINIMNENNKDMQNEIAIKDKELTMLKYNISKYECVICMDNNKNIILQPCGHLVYCNECYDNYYNAQKFMTCPICRNEIANIIKIYN